jgi:hypothetical protein
MRPQQDQRLADVSGLVTLCVDIQHYTTSLVPSVTGLWWTALNYCCDTVDMSDIGLMDSISPSIQWSPLQACVRDRHSTPSSAGNRLYLDKTPGASIKSRSQPVGRVSMPESYSEPRDVSTLPLPVEASSTFQPILPASTHIATVLWPVRGRPDSESADRPSASYLSGYYLPSYKVPIYCRAFLSLVRKPPPGGISKPELDGSDVYLAVTGCDVDGPLRVASCICGIRSLFLLWSVLGSSG